jgi:ubiquinone biosynthesis accessory factor UbiJ
MEDLMALIGHPAVSAVNHVLRSAPLALERLRPHAGRTVGLSAGPLRLALTIQTTGEVAAALPGTPHDLEVRASPFLLPRLALREEAAFAEIEMQGDPALAADIGFLARNLTWDAEEDLARVTGDIAAHRIANAVRDLGAWGRDASWRIAQGAAEYWTEEAGLLASRVKVESLAHGVAELVERLERLEARVESVARN